MHAPLLTGASIDHVELFVPDRPAAARWYARVLGLQPVEAFARWVTDRGPLMLTADQGQSMIALFIGAPCAGRAPRSHARVAFRVGGPEFLRFVERVAEGPVFDDAGQPLDGVVPVDHGGAYSVYFNDPWGHLIEVTTYDWRFLARHGDPAWLGESRALLAEPEPGLPMSDGRARPGATSS